MTRSSLQRVAAGLWFVIGAGLLLRGGLTLKAAHALGASPLGLGIAALAGLIVGAAKGKFVLAKSALRNKDRIAGLEEPVKPWQVFAPAFYPLIALMMGGGIAIRKLWVEGGGVTANLIYGGVLCGIGGALFVSAFAYIFDSAFRKAPKAPAEQEAAA